MDGVILKNQRHAINPDNDNVTYPTKVTYYRSGLMSNFRIVVHIDEKLKYLDREDPAPNHHDSYIANGVKYLLHSPYEMITRSTKSLQSSEYNSLKVFVTPQFTWIDDHLKEYPPNRRGCFLPNEKPLKYFKKFTKGNCQSECLINATLDACGCVQFFMNRDSKTRVCGVNDMKCYKNIEDRLEEGNKCSCYLECGEIEYNFEIARLEYVR